MAPSPPLAFRADFMGLCAKASIQFAPGSSASG